MRWVIAGGALGLLAVGAWLWLAGGDRVVMLWALEGQRAAQDTMAGALRRLRAGDMGAVTGLLALCFSYGFFHAAGPGHGKILIGGYGAARPVGALRLSLVALASSLAQGATAVLLVGLGVWLFALGRAQLAETAERALAPVSFGATAVIGLWLVGRGGRTLWRLWRTKGHAHHGDGHVCASCGHAHGPDPQALARAGSWRETLALVGAVAIRPCTGAVFLLVLTAQFGLFWVGVAGALVMALGTASLTILVALFATGLRRAVLQDWSEAAGFAVLRPGIEIAVGLLVAVVGLQLAFAAL